MSKRPLGTQITSLLKEMRTLEHTNQAHDRAASSDHSPAHAERQLRRLEIRRELVQLVSLPDWKKLRAWIGGTA